MYELIQRIQAYMYLLDLYAGRCDGAWGPASVDAKREWEKLDSFEPAVINNGQPFFPGCKLPASFTWAGRKLVSTKFTEHQVSEAIKRSGGFITNAEIERHVLNKPEPVKEVAKPVVQAAPKADIKLDVKPEPAKTEPVKTQDSVQQ